LVDPALGSLEIFELVDGRFVKLDGRTSGTFPAAGCEGLSIDLDALWASSIGWATKTTSLSKDPATSVSECAHASGSR
jgi:hypothetical protein